VKIPEAAKASDPTAAAVSTKAQTPTTIPTTPEAPVSTGAATLTSQLSKVNKRIDALRTKRAKLRDSLRKFKCGKYCRHSRVSAKKVHDIKALIDRTSTQRRKFKRDWDAVNAHRKREIAKLNKAIAWFKAHQTKGSNARFSEVKAESQSEQQVSAAAAVASSAAVSSENKVDLLKGLADVARLQEQQSVEHMAAVVVTAQERAVRAGVSLSNQFQVFQNANIILGANTQVRYENIAVPANRARSVAECESRCVINSNCGAYIWHNRNYPAPWTGMCVLKQAPVSAMDSSPRWGDYGGVTTGIRQPSS